MRAYSRLAGIVLLALALPAASCAGGRGELIFDNLDHPASASGYLRDADGRILGQEEVDMVGHVRHKHRFYGMVWGLVGLERTHDASGPINQQVGELRGDGVVNLTVTSKGCFLNYFPILSALPFWPGCVDVVVEGDVVRVGRGDRPEEAMR